jgi:hypothetical protein
MIWLTFFTGMLLGTFLGILVASLCHMSARAGRHEEESGFAKPDAALPSLKLVKGSTTGPSPAFSVLHDDKHSDSSHQVA